MSDEQKSDDKKGKDGPKTPTARKQEQRRQEKLALVQQQIDEGSLTIRQMTPEERKKYPPRPRKQRKQR